MLRIEIENFKSFREPITVGPFEDLTAVIGQNGAGKSNVMDAVCFVLGVTSDKLRGTRPQDLIHRPSGEIPDRESPKSSDSPASVRLVCDVEPPLPRTFERRVLPASGDIEHLVDGHMQSEGDYNAQLVRAGMRGHLKNVMIFQNEVETIASKSPMELTRLLEQVSGSEDLKAKYDRSKATLDRAEAEVTFVFQKRRGLLSARKQMAKQREEADRYRDLKSQLWAAQRKLLQFRAYHAQCDSDEKEAELQRRQRALAEASERLEVAGREKQKATRLAAERRLTRNRQLAELSTARKERDRLHLELAGVQAKLERNRRSREDERLAAAREQVQQSSRNLSAMESALRDLNETITGLHSELGQFLTEHSVADESLREYRTLRARSDAENCEQLQEVNALRRTQRAVEQRRDLEEHRHSELQSAVAHLDRRLADAIRARDENQAQLDDRRAKVTALDDEIADGLSTSEEYGRQLEDFRATAEKLSAELAQRTEQRELSAHQARMEIALTSMRRLFPGTRGALGEMVRPLHSQHDVAIQAIVVDTAETAAECIEYLRGQRIGRATFLPLASLRPEPDSVGLLDRDGTHRLAVDLIEVDDEAVLPAVRHVLRDARVCGTLDEARRFRFEERRARVKICTLDGTVISKSGFITGGSAGKASAHHAKWNQRTHDRQKSRLQAVRDEMGSLELRLRKLSKAQLPGLRLRRQTTEAEAQSLEEALGAAKSQIRGLEDSVQRTRDELRAAEARVVDSSRDLEDLEARAAAAGAAISEVAERVFREFTRELGCSSVAEFEARVITRERALSGRITQLERQRDRFTAQVDYERSRNLEHHVTEAEAAARTVRTETEKLKAEEQSLQAEHDTARRTAAALEAQAAELSTAVARLEQEENDAKRRHKAISEETSALRKDVHADEEALRSLGATYEDLLARLREHGTDGEADRTRATRPRKATASYALADDERQSRSLDDRLKWEREQGDRISELERGVSEIDANLRARRGVEDIEARIARASEEFDAARATAVDAARTYGKLQRHREEKFAQCLRRVARNTAEIYTALTSSKAHPQGGSAHLSSESPEASFLSGIKFSVMPPSKRFRDIDQLSGGERTIAALALLFAIHKFSASPFLIMDEPDAALDSRNLHSVALFLREMSQSTQVIVISLKDGFFAHADALVGVYRKPTNASSAVLTYSLSRRFSISDV